MSKSDIYDMLSPEIDECQDSCLSLLLSSLFLAMRAINHNEKDRQPRVLFLTNLRCRSRSRSVALFRIVILNRDEAMHAMLQ